MKASIPGGRVLAVLAISLLGATTAGAAPFNAPAKPAAAPGAESTPLVPVQYTYRERRVIIRDYDDEPDYFVRDYYERPATRVYGWSSRRYYDADYYDPPYYGGGVRVRAPFIDLYVD